MRNMKRFAALGLALVMGVSAAGCANDKKTVETPQVGEIQEAVEEDPEDYEDFEEEDDSDEEEDYDDEEYEDEDLYEEADEEEPEEEEEEEGQIAYDEVMNSYNEIVELYNEVQELYLQEGVPKDDGVEEILSEVSEEMDRIALLDESDMPTDSDKMEVMIRIGELNEQLGNLIEPLVNAAEEEAAYYNDLSEVVEANYDYMNQYFNTVWDYFSANGGSDEQISAVVQARDEIGDLDGLSDATSDDLREISDRIDHVIELLDAIWDSM